MERTNHARVHRFRDDVAFHVGDGDTVYVSPLMARRLAGALLAAAADCKGIEFCESNFSTVDVFDEDLAPCDGRELIPVYTGRSGNWTVTKGPWKAKGRTRPQALAKLEKLIANNQGI